jgi:cytochrome c peroxidase
MPAPRVTAAARFTELTRRWLALALAAGWGLAPSGETRAGEASAGETSASETSASEAPFYAESFEKVPSAAALRALGRALFFDASLSASGKMACATCHDPAHAFSPASGLQRGGGNTRAGLRAVPSLTYTQNVPPFTEHSFDSDGDDGIDQGPAGGRNWDGRSQSAHDQARVPLFSPSEMANPGPDAVVDKVRSAPYAAQLREAFGDRVFSDPALVFKGVLLALETFQQTPEAFYPYTSKYDAYLRREAALSPQEARGLDAFNDPAKGNCARCHPSAIREGAFPPFTDFGYAALGVPRNMALPANADPRFHDLGLCGPLRSDLKEVQVYCGLFRTPSLRNVALKRRYFHNGVFHRLEDAVRFYAERDTAPQKWYARSPGGGVVKFDDLPAQYWSNLDSQPPLDRHLGERPPLNDAEIRDIVAFLKTLTDGYAQPRGAPPRASASASR